MISLRTLIFCLMVILAPSLSAAGTTRAMVNEVISKPVIRGGIVFKHYCTLCHGERGDGVARAAKLYTNIPLAIDLTNSAQYEQVIRLGGRNVGKSDFMPPWEGELSDEQINDVMAYLQVLVEPESRGEVVFKTNCILCHGINGDGKGRAAKLYDPPPADLVHSDKNADYKESIIRYGGKAMGRSDVMPIWGNQLSDQEIMDLVAYLTKLAKR